MLHSLLACNASGDTALAESDTEVPQDSPTWGGWPPLSRQPAYESEEDGYATGAGFADFDGDGDQDLLVAYGNDIQRGPLALYWNEGGRLSPSADWISPDKHYYGHLSLGDLDGDGDTDLAVSRFLGDDGFSEPGGVQVWLNEQGALTLAWEDQGFYSFSCALGDLDGDGDLDLAAAVGEAYHNDPGGNRVWLNDGSGSFLPHWTGPETHSMDVGWFDADGDGDLDLASANVGGAHTIHLNDDGDLTLFWQADGDRFEGNTLDFGDVDGDGAADLVISDNLQLGGPGVVSAWCGPSYALCWRSEDTPRYQSAVSLEDVDGDGDLDLVAGAWGIGSFNGDALRLYENDGGLEVRASWSTQSEGVAEALAWADLDGSDHQELLIEHAGGLLRLAQGTEVVSLDAKMSWDGRHVSGAPGSIVARAPAPRDLAVSNWNKSVGNFVFLRQTP